MGLKKYFIKSRIEENIETEEVFLDAEAIRSLEEKGKLEYPVRRRNFILFYILIVGCLLGLFFRIGYLQVVKGDYYQDLAQGNRLRIYSTAAPRGIIYDRYGKSLVYNTPSFDLLVNTVDFLDSPFETQQGILSKISSVILSQESLLEEQLKFKDDLSFKIGEAYGQVSQLLLLKNIERSSALILEGLVSDWPGIRIRESAQRQYYLGPYFSHILGYTGEVDPSDLEDNSEYLIGDQIGKIGLERKYEDLLRGLPGQEQIEVNSLGKTQRLLANKLAQPGQGLVLSIDRDLQEKVFQSLSEMIKKLSVRRAAAVAIDPRDGGVLALVSLPSFDNNLFARGISQENFERLDNDSGRPFLNRPLTGQYPSGSIIKPLIAAGALEEEIISSRQQVNCQGGISVVNQYNPEIIYSFPDWKVHGFTDMIKAIAQSCNTYFYTIGGGYGRIDGLGIDKIKEYLQYFGLGQATGIDLPHEEVGLIPDKTWKKLEKPTEEWYLGDTYHLSIGQGDILVTPLQMTSAIAAIANGGTLYQPQIVDKIVDLDKNLVEDISSEIIRENFINPANISVVQEGMRQAVLDGSAISLSSLSVKAAGKTGTAQFGRADKTHAWFIGFAPYDEPEIVLTVLVEGGGEGYKAAVPVAKQVFEWYFNQ